MIRKTPRIISKEERITMAQIDRLSNREKEVVQLLLQGKSNKLIALSLGISIRTVEFHLKNVYVKFQVRSRVELVLKLVNTTGGATNGEPGYSLVDGLGENSENRVKLNSRMDWAASLRAAVSMIVKELKMKILMKNPSAFLPLAMSLAALATIAFFIAFNGTAPQADEGAAAHIWQILMAAQVPIVLFFALRWLPQSPRQAIPILGLQVGAALAAMAPVFLLHW
jgi:DNA-binding CsgD family transcriptional regulator